MPLKGEYKYINGEKILILNSGVRYRRTKKVSRKKRKSPKIFYGYNPCR